MILSIKKKEKIIFEVQKKIKSAVSIIIASLTKIKSNSMNQLRKELRELGAYAVLVPNTLLRIIIKETSCESLSKFCTGQNIVVCFYKNIGESVRVLINFSENNDNFIIKGAIFEDKFINLNQIHLLSKLPNYQESIVYLVLILKMISIGNFINTLKKISDKLS